MDMAQYGLTFMCDNPEDLYFFVKALYFDPLVWLFGVMVFAIFCSFLSDQLNMDWAPTTSKWIITRLVTQMGKINIYLSLRHRIFTN